VSSGRIFKCGVCLKEHQTPEEGFALNEIVYELLTSEQIEISHNSNNNSP